MRMTAEVKEHLPLIFEVVARLPEDQHFDIGFPLDFHLSFQAETQAEAATVRGFFPGAIWEKKYKGPGGCPEWWEYHTTWRGLKIQIYAVYEAPPTCRAVQEEVEVEEQVPVAWETRRVTQKKTRWECGEEMNHG